MDDVIGGFVTLYIHVHVNAYTCTCKCISMYMYMYIHVHVHVLYSHENINCSFIQCRLNTHLCIITCHAYVSHNVAQYGNNYYSTHWFRLRGVVVSHDNSELCVIVSVLSTHSFSNYVLCTYMTIDVQFADKYILNKVRFTLWQM